MPARFVRHSKTENPSNPKLEDKDHKQVPCPVCGGSGGKCSKCHGKGTVSDWGSTTLDALESSYIADVSYPPNGEQPSQNAGGASYPPATAIPQHQTAQPYNPGVFENMVKDMHPAAQYTYQRAVQQGIRPEEAIQQAQQKQGEMAQRAQEGQNIEGVQIPVISKADDVNRNPIAEILDSNFNNFVPTLRIQQSINMLS